MTGVVRARTRKGGWHVAAWLPLVVLPAAVWLLSAEWPAWARMWVLAISIYGSFKWLTFAASEAARRVTFWEAAGYLLLWTGMDAEAFLRGDGGQGAGDRARARRIREGLAAVGMIGAGAWVLVGLAPVVIGPWPVVGAWLTMMAVVATLHFGVSRLLSIGWRMAGFNARPLMHKPVLANSLSDFWGRRWNLAFRDLAHRFVFQPLVGGVGVAWATMAVFLVSGLIHDAVISLTASGGWGLPTLYFLIQGLALLLERSRIGRRLGLGRGLVGWLFAAVVVVGPVGLLFHRPFATRVIAPMLEAIQRLI